MRGKPFLKGHSPWNKQNFSKICKECSKTYILPKSRLDTSKFCGRLCRGNWESKNKRGENAHNFKHGFYLRNTKRMAIDLPCQYCSKIRKTMIHHIDHNRSHNTPDNLIRICYPCHTRIHLKNLYPAIGTKLACPNCQHQFIFSFDLVRTN